MHPFFSSPQPLLTTHMSRAAEAKLKPIDGQLKRVLFADIWDTMSNDASKAKAKRPFGRTLQLLCLVNYAKIASKSVNRQRKDVWCWLRYRSPNQNILTPPSIFPLCSTRPSLPGWERGGEGPSIPPHPRLPGQLGCMQSPNPLPPPALQGRPTILPVCPHSAGRRNSPKFSSPASHSAWSWSFTPHFQTNSASIFFKLQS